MRRMFGFMIGIMVGTLVGSTVALLLAPETGAQLRNEVRARGENFLGDVRRAAETRRTQLTDQLQAMRGPRGG
jgi:gas vesicle protein